MNLSGKTILITGGRRVGAQLAQKLAARGANVALSYFKSRQRMEDVAQAVREQGVRAEVFAADLRQPADAERLVGETCRTFGALHGLVNMASEFHATPFDTLTPAHVEASISANLLGPCYVALAAARAMRSNPIENGVQGKIVNFADWAVDRPYRDFLPYFVAKGGMVTLTKALAVELSPTIAVNAIAPAMIDPPPGLSVAEIEEISRAALLQRVGTPDDANNLVLYLLEGTDFASGTVYRIDGGRFLRGADGER